MTRTTAPKRDLDAIIAWLDAGLTLSTHDAQGHERRYYAGEITRERNARGSVRTTHLSDDLGGYVWLTKIGIARLATYVREHWHQIEAMQAQRDATVRRALDQ